MDKNRLTLQLSDQEMACLDDLVGTGLYGPTRADAAERLIAVGIEERVMSGVLDDTRNEKGKA